MVKLWELQHPPATECFTTALCEQGMSQTAALYTCLGFSIKVLAGELDFLILKHVCITGVKMYCGYVDSSLPI